MNEDYILLKRAPYAREMCPKCQTRFPEFLRGIVINRFRKFLRLRYCAIICHECKEVIGWEKPGDYY